MMMKRWLILLSLILLHSVSCSDIDDEVELPDMVDDPDPIGEVYFPPLNGDEWETTSPEELNWNSNDLPNLRMFLSDHGTKGFMILKEGKIVMEEYFNDHSANDQWEWYSVVKSLTSVLVGIATMEEHLDIEAPSSDYLGTGWSSLSEDQEIAVSVKNHLTMTTGCVNPIGQFVQWICTAPACFNYEADPGTRWAYHQGAFTLTQDIISASVGMDFKSYNEEKILSKIGMQGSWTELASLRIFSTDTRSMARFGWLVLNEGVWEDEVIYPSDYHIAMTATSQEMNKSYGYLWWLNGKQDFLTTDSQTINQGPLIPNAPNDMFAALGAQDQKIYIVPSKDLVIIRTGESAGEAQFATSSFDNELWKLLNELMNE